MNPSSPDQPDAPRPMIRRVLVVDDDPTSAQGLAMILRHEGYEVRTASDGESALEVAVVFGPDAILSDLGLPGIDGHELARRVQSDRVIASRLRLLVAVTGQSEPEIRRRSREAGFARHLAKPIDPEVILALLASIEWQHDPAAPVS